MRRAGWVAWRELQAYFSQPAAWVFLAVFLVVSAHLGLRNLFEQDVADLRDHFQGLRWALAFLAPAAAMRLVAEERRVGTIELLFALPISAWEAVLGKFLAAYALVATGLLLSTSLPLLVLPLGPFDPGQIAAGYLGALLLAAVYVAVGLLASSLTRSQVLAFVVGAALCLGLGLLGDPLLLDKLQRLLPRQAVNVLRHLGAGEHLEAFNRGVVDLRDALYFLFLAPAFLFFSVLGLERKEPDRREPWLAAGLALLALLLGLVLLAEPGLRVRADLTRDGRNTLSPELREVLARLRVPLTVRAYISQQLPEGARPHLRRIRDLMDDLAAEMGPRCEIELIDPRSPELDLVEQQRLTEQAQRDGVLEVLTTVQGEGDRAEQAPMWAGIAVLAAGRAPAAIPFALGSQDLQADLGAALQRVAFPRLRVGIAGQGLETYKRLEQSLAATHSLQEIDLAQVAAVESQVALLVYACPVPPEPAEVEKVVAYVKGGGHLLVLVEGHWADQRRLVSVPFGQEHPLAKALAGWGLALGGQVAAPSRRSWPIAADGKQVMGPYPWYLLADGGSADPALGLSNAEAVLPFAAEVVRAPSFPPGAEWRELVRSAPGNALPGEVDVHPLRAPSTEGAAPRALAAAVTLPGPRPTRVVVVGDADLCRDSNQGPGPGGVPLVQALVDWALDRALARRGQGLPPRLGEADALGMSPSRWQNVVLFMGYFGVPGAVLCVGLALVQLRLQRAVRRAAALREQRAAAVKAAP